MDEQCLCTKIVYLFVSLSFSKWTKREREQSLQWILRCLIRRNSSPHLNIRERNSKNKANFSWSSLFWRFCSSCIHSCFSHCSSYPFSMRNVFQLESITTTRICSCDDQSQPVIYVRKIIFFFNSRTKHCFLVGLPSRRYQQRVFDSSVFPSTSNSDDPSDQQGQRHKRIYWENLAFHAADYNQKPKKV